MTKKFEFKTVREKKTYKTQMEMYKNSMTDNAYMYTKNNSFKHKKNDVKIVAKKNIQSGVLLKTLCGQTVVIKSEDVKVCSA